MSNKALKEHLVKLEKHCKVATTKEHIEDVVSEIEEYSKFGDYSLKQPVVTSIIFMSIFAIVVPLILKNIFNIHIEIFGGMVIGGFYAFIIFIVVYFYRKAKVFGVGSEAYYKSVAIHNNLVEEYDFDGYEMWSSLRKEFPFFNAGDEGQEISKLYKSKAEDGTGFSLFQFKYVEVTEEEEEDSDGNKTTKTTRTTCYQFGCIVELVAFNGITINSGRYKEKWNSSSKNFNNRFKVRCSNSIEAAKFFTPSVVLKFEDEFSVLDSLDVLDNSKACLGLNKSVFPTHLKPPAIKKTEDFISHLRNPQTLSSLQSAKQIISYINERTKNKLKKAG